MNLLSLVTRSKGRLAREARTVEAMVRLHCRGQHGTQDGRCSQCEVLREYALERLRRCPFQEGKTTCAKCPVHCYRPDMRAQIRAVMRYAGPRMLARHPLLTLYHLLDGRREEPARPPQKTSVDPL